MKQRIRNCKIINTILIVIVIVSLSLTAFTFKIYKSVSESLCFSEKNVDDPYGKLDRNTQEVIEKALNKAMDEKHVPFCFALVYEDANISYSQNFSENSVVIYFNKTTNVLKTTIESNEFNQPINSQDDLTLIFDNYVSEISEYVERDNSVSYYSSEKSKNTFKYLALGAFVLLCIVSIFLIFFSFAKIRRNNLIIKRTLREEKIRKERRRRRREDE